MSTQNTAIKQLVKQIGTQNAGLKHLIEKFGTQNAGMKESVDGLKEVVHRMGINRTMIEKVYSDQMLKASEPLINQSQVAKGLGFAGVSTEKIQNATSALLAGLKKLTREYKKILAKNVIFGVFFFSVKNPICAGKRREM